MTRYIVFLFEKYEPRGGAHDCTGVFDTLEEAKAAAKALRRKRLKATGFNDDDDYFCAHVLEVGETLIAHCLTPDGIHWQTHTNPRPVIRAV